MDRFELTRWRKFWRQEGFPANTNIYQPRKIKTWIRDNPEAWYFLTASFDWRLHRNKCTAAMYMSLFYWWLYAQYEHCANPRYKNQKERNRIKRRRRLGYLKAAKHLRRSRMRGRTHTEADWQALLDYYGRKCLGCGKSEADLARIGRLLVRDHVRPIAKYGSNCLSNLQPLCHSTADGSGCNNKKHTALADHRPGMVRFFPAFLFAATGE